MPPKVPRPANQGAQLINNQAQQGNINYKLPPRPGTKQSSATGASENRVNQSYDLNRNSR